MKESRIGSIASDIIDLVGLGLLWLVCSLPVVTLGAASTALYHSVVKCLRHERGSCYRTFFQKFASDFKVATLLWLVYAAYLALMWFDMSTLTAMGLAPEGSVLYYVTRLLFLPAVITLPWAFPFVSRFTNSLGGNLRFVCYLAIRNFPATLLLLAELAVVGLICYLLPQVALLLPGVAALLQSFAIEPAFKPLYTEEAEATDDPWYLE